MPLIASISGIRGTIGNKAGENLTPIDIVKYCTAFARVLNERAPLSKGMIVVGRDARISGPMVNKIVCATLNALGLDVLDIGLAPTPTVELAVKESNALGGVIITASHNPAEWNALKLLGPDGEFISADRGQKLLSLLEESTSFATVQELGQYREDHDWINRHIDQILDLELVDKEAIKKAGLRVVVDVVNSVGGLSVPPLLERLGIHDYTVLNGDAHGDFAHNPEPLPENLVQLSELCSSKKALGIAVDPDVDRLALVCEDGSFFGEEFTLVAVADYVLQHHPGNTVSNLSSTNALGELSRSYGFKRYTSAVGEVNVVKEMKRVGAVIGGEGNGGVIYPPMHYGRDALTGIALFLSYLARSGSSAKDVRKKYPTSVISKNKINLPGQIDIDDLLDKLGREYSQGDIDRRDGLWIGLGPEWIHIRKSNTEPILRIYTESDTASKAESLAASVSEKLQRLLRSS